MNSIIERTLECTYAPVAVISTLIWPYGYMFYMAMTSSIFRSAIGGGVYLKISLPLLVASVYGGLIGIVFATGFSKKNKTRKGNGGTTLRSA